MPAESQMDLEGAISSRPAEARHGADFLISDAVSLVVACISGSEVREDQVAPLLHDVHRTLLGIAVSAGALPGLPSRAEDETQFPARAEALAAIGERELEILKEMGVSAAEIRRTAAHAPFVDLQPESETAFQAPEEYAAAEEAAATSGAAIPAAAETQEPPLKPEKPATPQVSKAQAKPKAPVLRLPKGLKSADEALGMSTIVCLEDGKKVKDLAAHLAAKGVSAADYKAKWGLPPEYPTQAPSRILKSGATYEVDFATGRFKPVR